MVDGTFDAFLYDAILSERDLKGSLCFDIGSHFGYHSLGFAAAGAKVLAFEPNDHNIARFKLHLERNPAIARNIRLIEAAVSDQDGEVSFIASPDMAGQSSGSHLAAATPPLTGETYAAFSRVNVRSVKLDTLVAQGQPPPDIIKIDVEGGECLALQGGRKMLQESPALLLMEVHHICLMQQVQELLTELGYGVRILNRDQAVPSRCFIMALPR